VKFADADLIGIPRRIVVGDRALKDGNVEYRERRESETQLVALDAVAAKIGAG
jgi:prolyl-tRNA synthetase